MAVIDDDKLEGAAKFLLGWLDYGTPQDRAKRAASFPALPPRVDPFAPQESNFPLTLGGGGAAPAAQPSPEAARFLTQAAAVQQQAAPVQTLAQRRQVPLQQQARQAGITQPGTPPPPGSETMFDQFAKQRADLMGRLEQQYQPPDYRGLQRQMMERSAGAMPAMAGAVLAGLGPQQVAGPMQQSLLKIAEEARAPMKVEGGTIDAQGRLLLDPGFQRQRQIEFLSKRIDALDKLEAGERDKQRAAALKAQADQDRHMMMLLIAQGQQDTKQLVASIAKGLGGGKVETSQFVDARDNTPLAFDKAANAVYRIGDPNRTPVPQQFIKRHVEATAGEREKLGDVRIAQAGIDRVIGMIDVMKPGDERGMSLVAGGIRELPGVGGPLGQVMSQKWMTEAGRNIRQAATYTTDAIRNTRFGATLTALEKASAGEYLISAYDDPPMIKQKLQNIRTAMNIEEAIRQGTIQPNQVPGGVVGAILMDSAKRGGGGGRNFDAEYGIK